MFWFRIKRIFLLPAFLMLLVPALAGDFKPQSFTCILQAELFNSSRLTAATVFGISSRDLIIIDYAYNKAPGGKWTPDELALMRASNSLRKVVAYISIGEAEDYRPYWKPEWDADKDGSPDKEAPAFLDKVNPDWKGNYKVKYWQKEWQDIVFKYLDEIIAQGFDGIYLDIVDAFEYYEFNPATKEFADNRINPETKNTYRRDMIEWVKAIVAHTRKTKPGFIVIPQNGSQLLEHKDFLDTIDAIGVENLFTNGNNINPDKETEYRLGFLDKAGSAGKPVLIIEYCEKEQARRHAMQASKRHGFVALLTKRELRSMGVAVPP
jgi:cysteinyl-tRNA synthetase